MISFFGVYVFIVVAAVISSFLYDREKGIKKKLKYMFQFSIIYYWITCFFRTLAGNAHSYLGISFLGKSWTSYLKLTVLLLLVFVAVSCFCKFFKEKGSRYINCVVGIFSALALIFSTVVDIPNLLEISIMGVLALFLAGIVLFLPVKDKIIYDKKQLIDISILILMFSCLFLITGPAELFIYNAEAFSFSFANFFSYMLVYTILLLFLSTAFVMTKPPKYIFYTVEVIIFIYSICSYLQQMFLNGNMQKMEGVAQKWSQTNSIVNIIIWLVLTVVLLLILKKWKYGRKFMLGISIYVIGIQLITLLTMMMTNSNWHLNGRQLLKDGSFTLSANENVVVFILDAYDTQMLNMVLDDDENYLNPLHDFTYFKNSNSRYYATDGSLPYFLTGRIKEEEKEYLDIYRKSTFLKDIKNQNYNIHLLTEEHYVHPFEEGLIDNYRDDYECLLAFEKTVSQMSKCVRYRTAPFVLKPYYYYENYHLTNMIEDSNVYLFGTDAEFYETLVSTGIEVDETKEHMFQLYHLYGAHSPYYLTENAELDYGSNPLAQWRGSLKIVYDYIDELKKKDIYNQTNIIIMADHGLNRSQRMAMDEWQIEVTDNSNPIFFIKPANQKQEKLLINEKKISHDHFFATIMYLITGEDSKYGESVFD